MSGSGNNEPPISASAEVLVDSYGVIDKLELPGNKNSLKQEEQLIPDVNQKSVKEKDITSPDTTTLSQPESTPSDSVVSDNTHNETMASHQASAGNVNVHTLPLLPAKKNSHTQELDSSHVPAESSVLAISIVEPEQNMLHTHSVSQDIKEMHANTSEMVKQSSECKCAKCSKEQCNTNKEVLQADVTASASAKSPYQLIKIVNPKTCWMLKTECAELILELPVDEKFLLQDNFIIGDVKRYLISNGGGKIVLQEFGTAQIINNPIKKPNETKICDNNIVVDKQKDSNSVGSQKGFGVEKENILDKCAAQKNDNTLMDASSMEKQIENLPIGEQESDKDEEKCSTCSKHCEHNIENPFCNSVSSSKAAPGQNTIPAISSSLNIKELNANISDIVKQSSDCKVHTFSPTNDSSFNPKEQTNAKKEVLQSNVMASASVDSEYQLIKIEPDNSLWLLKTKYGPFSCRLPVDKEFHLQHGFIVGGEKQYEIKYDDHKKKIKLRAVQSAEIEDEDLLNEEPMILNEVRKKDDNIMENPEASENIFHKEHGTAHGSKFDKDAAINNESSFGKGNKILDNHFAVTSTNVRLLQMSEVDRHYVDFVVKVIFKNDKTVNNAPMTLTPNLGDYMKYQFVINNAATFGCKVKEIKEKFNADLKVENGHIVVDLTQFMSIYVSNVAFNPDRIINDIIQCILSGTDQLILKKICTQGIDNNNFARQITQSKELYQIKKFILYVPETDCIYAIYQLEYEKIVSKVIGDVAKDLTLNNNKKHGQCTFPVEFLIVINEKNFKNDFEFHFQKHLITCTIKEAGAVALTLSGPADCLNAAAEFLEDKCKLHYGFVTIQFKEICKCDNFQHPSALIKEFLHSSFESKDQIFWQIDEYMQALKLWASDQPMADSVKNKVKKCIQKTTFDIEGIRGADKNELIEKLNQLNTEFVFFEYIDKVFLFGIGEYFTAAKSKAVQTIQDFKAKSGNVLPDMSITIALSANTEKTTLYGTHEERIVISNSHVFEFLQSSNKLKSIFSKNEVLLEMAESEIRLLGNEQVLRSSVSSVQKLVDDLKDVEFCVEIPEGKQSKVYDHINKLNMFELQIKILQEISGGQVQLPTKERISKEWTLPMGHCVVVASIQANVEVEMYTLDGSILIQMNGQALEATLFDKATTKIVLSWPIPEWKEGTSKEKEIFIEMVQNMIKEAQKTYNCTIIIDVEKTVSKWKYEVFIEVLIHAFSVMLTQVLMTTTIVLCVEDRLKYEACLHACTSAFPRCASRQLLKYLYKQTAKSSQSAAVQLNVVQGKLEKMKADIVVALIPASHDLSQGQVFQSLLQAAGKKLQEELKKKNCWQPIKVGDVFETEAYNILQSKFIFYGQIDKKDMGGSAKDIKDFVLNCLSKTISKNCNSIAFPALGIGALGFSVDEVAEAMFTGVNEFTKLPTKHTLDNVIFVIHPNDTDIYKAFLKREKRRSMLMQVIGVSKDVDNVIAKLYTIPEVIEIKCKGAQSQPESPVATKSDNVNSTTIPIVQEIDRDGSGDVKENKKNKTIWTKDFLVMPESLASYVIVSVPANITKEDLEKSIFKHGFPIPPPFVVYYQGEQEALLICNNSQEADKLDGFTAFAPFVFRKLQPPVLYPFNIHIDSCLVNAAKERGELKCLLDELKALNVEVKEKDNIIKVVAPAQYQFCCSHKIISLYKQKLESLQNVLTFKEVPVPMWDVINEELLRPWKIHATYNDGTISVNFHKSDILLAKIRDFINDLKTKDITEIPVPSDTKSNVTLVCSEVNQDMGAIRCCTFIENKNVIIAYCSDYEQTQHVKHSINIKLGILKETRRKGYKFKELISPQTDPSREQPVQQSSMRSHNSFDWLQNGKQCENFLTPEGIKVKVYVSSILSLDVQCIVNAANNMLSHGAGIARTIADAAGPDLVNEGNEILKHDGKISVGHVRSTSAGRLTYKKVIHAVGPDFLHYQPYSIDDIHRCEQDLYNAIFNSFLEAERLHLKSIALPAISSALFNVPKELCVHQYAKATLDYSSNNKGYPDRVEEIHFVDINDTMVESIQAVFIEWLRNKREPYYDSNKFVKSQIIFQQQSYGGDYNKQHGSGHDYKKSDYGDSTYNLENNTGPEIDTEKNIEKPITDPEPLSYEDNKTYVYLLCGNEIEKLLVSQGDMFQVKASVIVIPISSSGEGQVMVQMMEHLTENEKLQYEKDKEHYFTRSIGNGELIHAMELKVNEVSKFILHAIINSQPARTSTERKSLLETMYKNVFDASLKADMNTKVTSVALSLIDTGESDEDITLSARAFWTSYVTFCKEKLENKGEHQLVIHLVCQKDEMFELVIKLFNGYVLAQKEKNNEDNEATHGIDINTTDPKINNGHFLKEDCSICLDKVTNPKMLKCGHIFCTECIEQQFKFKCACPNCGAVCGIITGDQPVGTYSVIFNKDWHCAGYEDCGVIAITYLFEGGRQGPDHPNPQQYYKGIKRTGYLPDNEEGRLILELLKIAFHRKLIFTIGSSRTTGQEGVITWNDIHHKTDPRPYTQFGYPDPTYLARVKDELAAKGVTENDISVLCTSNKTQNHDNSY